MPVSAPQERGEGVKMPILALVPYHMVGGEEEGGGGGSCGQFLSLNLIYTDRH
jgi:hypothetical protein